MGRDEEAKNDHFVLAFSFFFFFTVAIDGDLVVDGRVEDADTVLARVGDFAIDADGAHDDE